MPDNGSPTDLADEASSRVRGRRTVAVAESLTGGLVSSALAKAPAASEWFRGGLVAYSGEVKHDVLGVPPGPVVSADAAEAMADGVRKLLSADVAVAVTGVGGPGEQDGCPAGTVFVAVVTADTCRTEHHRLDGDPGKICAEAVTATLALLLAAL
ncbi:competence damage-inducible protein A [Pseudonocardia sulfidoxydans NBRC 16205]|uniref:Competence damage-inducible protein A n=1 Tax=Pseudonocardia sulfidoxydans NBRC 16205 TaxID=1223511 RepID=A0A511DM06_9PSEU|nr:CinA family protein [Pseudonocardia sulfidoxydans]GEL25845.1 competence damage-inducible protein A [Pseudonocardia sulfidoxydans NBRC 16205]